MSAVAERAFLLEEGEKAPTQYRVMIGQKEK